MKQMTTRRLAALGLAAAMGLTLAACGEQQPSREEVEQAIEAGTLTVEDALDKGWIDQAWVDAYQEENSVPAGSKMEAGAVGGLYHHHPCPARSLPGRSWGTWCCSPSWTPPRRGPRPSMTGWPGAMTAWWKTAPTSWCAPSVEDGNELFAEAPFPVILYNDSVESGHRRQQRHGGGRGDPPTPPPGM